MRKTSMRHIGLAIALVSGLAIVVSERANATVLVQDTAGTMPNPFGFSAQSVTTPNGGPFTNITFNFYDSQGASTAPGLALIVLSQPFLGPGFIIDRGVPAELPGFLTKSLSNSRGEYRFDPTFTLNSNQQYFFYIQGELASLGEILIGGLTYTGGNYYLAPNSGSNYTSFPNEDADFSLSGTTTVPEPSSLALILPAIGAVLGLCRWRRPMSPARSRTSCRSPKF
jgi:hypothetical protein